MPFLRHVSLVSCMLFLPLRAQETSSPAAARTSLVLKSSRTSSLSRTMNGWNARHDWSGWDNRGTGTLGRFGTRPTDTIYRKICSFDLAEIPGRKVITGATIRLRLTKGLEAGCPVVPMMTLNKLPAEGTFGKSPDVVWAFMENNKLFGFPIPTGPDHTLQVAVDSPLLKHLRTCLKQKKPAPMVLGLKLETEGCVMYTLQLPVEIELTFAD